MYHGHNKGHNTVDFLLLIAQESNKRNHHRGQHPRNKKHISCKKEVVDAIDEAAYVIVAKMTPIQKRQVSLGFQETEDKQMVVTFSGVSISIKSS